MITDRLVFEHALEPWLLGLVVLPALLFLTGIAYRRRPAGRLRPCLAGLRLLSLLLTLGLVLGPQLRREEVIEEPAPFALLFDDSASMQRSDPSPRIDRLRAFASSPALSALGERYRLSCYRFAERLQATAANGSGLRAEGSSTALGSALLAVLEEHRGRRTPDILVVTDGRSNRGAPLAEAADLLAAEGVRVDVLAVGDRRPAPDLSLERVDAPDLALVGDEARFAVRLHARGTPVPNTLTVHLLDEEGRSLDRAVASSEPGGTLVHLRARLDTEGERRLTAFVEPLPEETAPDDNRVDFTIPVKSARIRVLYVEGVPRWEYRYLKNRLLRADREVALRCYLASAGRDFVQEASTALEPLRRLPLDLDTLLAEFDVILLGDVGLAALDPDPNAGERFLENAARFVERGGGLVVLAGPDHMPGALKGTPLEPLLPVLLGNEPTEPGPLRAVPTDPASLHPALRLEAGLNASRRLWSHTFPELWWHAPVERLRPGARALLVHDRIDNLHGPRPIVATGRAPDGWVVYVGIDETWRWRHPAGEEPVARFWRNLLRQAATTRLRGEQGRVRLDLDRSVAELGTPIGVALDLKNADYSPSTEERATVWLSVEGGAPRPLELVADPAQTGHFRGQVLAASSGEHRIYCTEDGSAESRVVAAVRFSAILPSLELQNASRDQAALELLTSRCRGRLVEMEQADALLASYDGRERLRRTISARNLPLDRAPWLALLVLLLAAEWILRKRSDLA